MAVTVEQPARSRVGVERGLLGCPLWILTTAAITVAALRYGIRSTQGVSYHLATMSDPFDKGEHIPAWLYASPLGPLTGWLLRVSNENQALLVHLGIVAVTLFGCAHLVAHKVSDLAGRLYVFAWLCSYQSWGFMTQGGTFGDVMIVGLLTVATVTTSPAVAVSVAVLLGFQHFELTVFAVAAVIVLRRRVLDDRATPVWWLVGGLVVGKVLNVAYLAAAGLPTVSRWEVIRAAGADNLIDGWKGQLPQLVFSCYHVAWVAVAWMLFRLASPRRWIVLGVQVALTVPVLLTYDLTRVYSMITWPVLVVAVIWLSRNESPRVLMRGAAIATLVLLVIPPSGVWHATGRGLGQFF